MPLKVYLPDYGYLLCDLTVYTGENLKDEVLLQAAMLTLEYVFRPELREHLPGLMGLLRELAERETGLEYVETLLRYRSAELTPKPGASSALRGGRGVGGGGRGRFSPGGRGADVYHSTEVGRART